MEDEYRVEFTETAEAEIDTIYLSMLSRSPEAATKWYVGLMSACDSLGYFPYRYQALPNRPDLRRFLYRQYRVIYAVFEPRSPEEEPVVRVMHVRHVSRQP